MGRIRDESYSLTILLPFEEIFRLLVLILSSDRKKWPNTKQEKY